MGPVEGFCRGSILSTAGGGVGRRRLAPCWAGPRMRRRGRPMPSRMPYKAPRTAQEPRSPLGWCGRPEWPFLAHSGLLRRALHTGRTEGALCTETAETLHMGNMPYIEHEYSPLHTGPMPIYSPNMHRMGHIGLICPTYCINRAGGGYRAQQGGGGIPARVGQGVRDRARGARAGGWGQGAQDRARSRSNGRPPPLAPTTALTANAITVDLSPRDVGLVQPNSRNANGPSSRWGRFSRWGLFS